MAVEDILGSNAMTRESRRRRKLESGATRYEETWRGPIPKADILYESYEADETWDDVNQSKDGGVGVVNISRVDEDIDPTDEDIQQSALWEVIPEELHKDLRAHPTFNQAADQTAIEAARLAFEAGNGDYDASANAAADTYLEMRRRGVEEYVVTVPVIQRTIRVTKRSDIAFSWSGKDKAWKIDEPNGPNPPKDILGVIADMPDADATKKQWLKRAGEIRRTSRDEIDIVYQWIWARRWSHTLYDGDDETDNP